LLTQMFAFVLGFAIQPHFRGQAPR